MHCTQPEVIPRELMLGSNIKLMDVKCTLICRRIRIIWHVINLILIESLIIINEKGEIRPGHRIRRIHSEPKGREKKREHKFYSLISFLKVTPYSKQKKVAFGWSMCEGCTRCLRYLFRHTNYSIRSAKAEN